MEHYQHIPVQAGPSQPATPTFRRVNYNSQLPSQSADYWRFPVTLLDSVARTHYTDQAYRLIYTSERVQASQEPIPYRSTNLFNPDAPSFKPKSSSSSEAATMGHTSDSLILHSQAHPLKAAGEIAGGAIDDTSATSFPKTSTSTPDNASSFDPRSQPSFTQFSGSSSVQDNYNSFPSQSEYETTSTYGHPTGNFDFSSPGIIKHEFQDPIMSGIPPNPLSFDSERGKLDRDARLHAVITDTSNIQAFRFLNQNIRDAVDTGLTKRFLLLAKVESVKQELDGPNNIVGANRAKKQVSGRRAPSIKPPRIDPYKLTEEHKQAVTAYQAEFKKRNQLKGYELLVALAEANINHLLDLLLEYNLVEVAINNFLEERANEEERTKLERLEWLIDATEKDLKDSWAGFSRLDNKIGH